MVGEFSLFHWLVVFAIVLLVFGPKRLPELAKALGSGIRDFKKALNGDEAKSPASPLPPAQQQPTIAAAKEVEPATPNRVS